MGGPDLPPFGNKDVAAAFAKANGGRVLGFGEVTAAVVRGLGEKVEGHQHR